ncbi:hypothetical protein BWI15_04310 [Kribbella sp. ALI-6-A]|uniref:hypothetical protein n=1 Tax=Kribbella sp. ALI-6-A TaxID=1933817 RepID=UPI00097CB6B5|nr:hypothetical protein [Kribbella sp. ALI-6-A]ONI76538.1 hypothetical protein BWI15_04310 [Kribbella sp. ALI-6-A]
MILRCEAVRWVGDDPIPGLVEVAFTDAEGTRHVLIDKPPVFSGANGLGPGTAYPVAVGLDCEVLRVDEEAVVITTERPWGVETADGRTEFRVGADQLGDIVAPGKNRGVGRSRGSSAGPA